MSNLTNEFPPLKKEIKGEEVWNVLNSIGESIFDSTVYFDVIAPEITQGSNCKNYTLHNKVLGRILTWADSAFEPERAKAVKDVLKEIITSEFKEKKDMFLRESTDLMKD